MWSLIHHTFRVWILGNDKGRELFTAQDSCPLNLLLLFQKSLKSPEMALIFYTPQIESHPTPPPPHRHHFRPGIGDTILTWLNSQKQQEHGFKGTKAGVPGTRPSQDSGMTVCCLSESMAVSGDGLPFLSSALFSFPSYGRPLI